MTTAPPPPIGWTRLRLAVAILLLTTLQAVVVLRFSAVPDIPLPAHPPSSQTSLLWSPSHVESAFTGVPKARRDLLERDPDDPFQFVARRSIPKAEYQLAEFRDPTRWLTNPPPLQPVPLPSVPSQPTVLPNPPLPAPQALPIVPRRSLVLTGGPLAKRPWLKPPSIASWPGPDSPGTTRFEVAVNPQGWLVVLRISESSGSREADDLGRESLLPALFTPLPGAPKRPSFDAAQLTWGTLTIEWGLRPIDP